MEDTEDTNILNGTIPKDNFSNMKDNYVSPTTTEDSTESLPSLLVEDEDILIQSNAQTVSIKKKKQMNVPLNRSNVSQRHGSINKNTGLVKGQNTIRRRPHATSLTITTGKTKVLTDEEFSDENDIVPQLTSEPMHRRSTRSNSLKNVAHMVRANIRRQKDNAASFSSSFKDQKISFSDVASQVVSSQRAAKGFMDLWDRGAAFTQIYKGIHMEKKKLDLHTLASERRELKRQQFYQELIVYFIFLTVFFSLLSWLPVQDSYQQNAVIGQLTCREAGVCELKSIDDMYDFADRLSISLCNPQSSQSRAMDHNAQWVRVGSVRVRQVRVKELECVVHGNWAIPCYPEFSASSEARDIIGVPPRQFKWMNGLPPLQPFESYSPFAISGADTYGNGGYVIDLCDNSINVGELKHDRWFDMATRAVAMEFVLMNPVTRVFTIGWHVFTVSPSGHVKHFPHSSNLKVIGFEKLVYAVERESNTSVNTTEYKGSNSIHSKLNSGSAVIQNKWNEWCEGQWMGYVRDGLDLVRQLIEQIFAFFDHRLILWSILVLFFVAYCTGELSEMSNVGPALYLRSDLWNVFEVMHLSLLILILCTMAKYYVVSHNFVYEFQANAKKSDSLDAAEIKLTTDLNTLELLLTFQHLHDLASLASAVFLLKVFKYLRMNSTLNLLWRVLGKALSDLMGFLVIFNLIFCGYAMMGCYAFGFALEEFSTLSKSYATCFHMLAGEMDYPRLRQANPRLAPVFIVTFIVLVFQILVNMFVAILSEYYESAKIDDGSNDDAEYDVITRVRKYLKAVSPYVVLEKPGDVIRLFPSQKVRLISTNLVDKEETRQRVRKLFRGAVWRVVALLRFGMKFDRRIQFERNVHNNHKYGSGSGSGSGEIKDSRDLVTHVRLSENFDHKTIQGMIPLGITVWLQGDSLLGDSVALKVVQHNRLSVECIVLGSADDYSDDENHDKTPIIVDVKSGETNIKVLELLGGEKLHIPWQCFTMHVFWSFMKELRRGFIRAIKLWNFSRPPLVDDYHLFLMFDSMAKENRGSLRFDEVYRMLDLYLRKDLSKRSRHCSQEDIRQETFRVMYRFRKCLIDMPSREKEGHNYRPQPVDTSRVVLGHLEHLAELLAQNCHDTWALERIKQGWVYGDRRDDKHKEHPNLVPFDILSDDEKEYDYRSSMESLKTIFVMNFSIHRTSVSSTTHSHSLKTSNSASLSRSQSAASDDSISSYRRRSPSEEVPETSGLNSKSKPVPALLREAMSFRRSSMMEDSPYFTVYRRPRTNVYANGNENDINRMEGVEQVEYVYKPLPIDTEDIEIPRRLIRLVDLLAENAHEVWAKGRIDNGWEYGPKRNDKAKKHPCLVPYVFLTDEEKEYDLNIAKETVKTLLAMKFNILDRSP